MEKCVENSPPKQGTKRPYKATKNENEVLSQVPVNEQLLSAAKEAEEAMLCKTPVFILFIFLSNVYAFRNCKIWNIF